MRIPDTLASLADYGIIDEVLRPLMSGKEAQIYLVLSDGEYRVAKVFKEAQNRTFKNRAEYTEGRKVRNTRDQRAMGKNTRHGRAQVEAAWRTTEVDMIYRLRNAGVRVPTPYHFIDGVLVMEMISDERGDPAPRLGDVVLEPEGAQLVFDRLLAEVVRMLAAGVVHGDLSDFNVLMAPDGPVVIDFPQAVDASSNLNARKLLLRDVDNLHRFMARFVPERAAPPYAQEMWALYERGELTPDTKLTGRYRPAERKVSTESVLDLIGDAARDERRRREHLGLSMRGAADEGGLREAPAAESAPRELSRYAQKRQAQVAAAAAQRAEAEKAALARRNAPREAPPQGQQAPGRSRDAGQSVSARAPEGALRPVSARASEGALRPVSARASEGALRPLARDANQARTRDGQGRSRDGGQQRLHDGGQHPRDGGQPVRDGGQQRPREGNQQRPRDGGQHPRDAGQHPRDGGQYPRDGGQYPRDGGQYPRDGGQQRTRDGGQQRPRDGGHVHARDGNQAHSRDVHQSRSRDVHPSHQREGSQQREGSPLRDDRQQREGSQQRDAGQQREGSQQRDAGQQRPRHEQRAREPAQDTGGRAPAMHGRGDAGAGRRAPNPQAGHGQPPSATPDAGTGDNGEAAQARRRRRRRRKPGGNAQSFPTR